MAGSNITLTVLGGGGNETLRISVSGLAAVATSGAYADLSGKPTLGTSAALDVDTDTTLAANSDVKVASQAAIRAYVAANAGPDLTPDIGGLWLAMARLSASTAPEQSGQEVADEFDDATGISSLGGATVASGYLSNPGGQTQIAQATGTAIGDMTGSGGVAAAFDGTTAQTNAQGAGNAGGAGFVGKDWGAGVTKTLTGFKVYGTSNGGFDSASYGTVTISLHGNSVNDPVTSTSLFSVSGVSSTASAIFAQLSGITTTSAYRYHWVKINGAYATAAEVQFFETPPPANITTVSNAYTALAAPATVSIVVEYQDISTAATLNTDITLEVSRDGGTTWTAVTLSDFGPSPISGARVLQGSSSVSGQPSGTSIKWRVKTFNAKEQRVHGVWMKWR